MEAWKIPFHGLRPKLQKNFQGKEAQALSE